MSDTESLLSLRDARRLVGGLSESTIRRLLAEDAFPRPIVLARTRSGRPCRIAFVASEIHSYVVEKIRVARAKAAE